MPQKYYQHIYTGCVEQNQIFVDKERQVEIWAKFGGLWWQFNWQTNSWALPIPESNIQTQPPMKSVRKPMKSMKSTVRKPMKSMKSKSRPKPRVKTTRKTTTTK